MSEETAESNPHMKRNRKKRKNFLANAKKYAKKGQMGRGARMPEELYQYFVGILDAMKQGIEDKEERVALVNNVLERTKGEELNVVGNQLGCRVVELLLPYASPEDLERFIEVLSPELRRLCSDNFTSHVIETLLRVTCERALAKLQIEDDEVPKKKKKKSKEESEYSEEHLKNCYDFTIKICKYALNNLEDFVWDQYANHILRSALKCLSGITLLPGEKPKTNIFKETVADDKGIPPHLTKMDYKNVPEEFKELVLEFANRLSSWPQFKDLPYQNTTSALLQVLLYAIKNVDSTITKDLVKKLLNESFAPDDWIENGSDEKKGDDKVDVDNKDFVGDENGDGITEGNLPPVFQSQSAVRLLEAALFVAKKKMYTQIYAKCFINRLGRLSLLPMLNFTVQRLVDNCQVKEEFEPMFDELSGRFGAILACGNTGVLVALAKACLRLRARQAQYITSLETAFKCTEESQKYFSVLCLRLLPLERVDVTKLETEYFIHVHGSVILQTILEFQRPAKAVNSLLELSPEALLVVFCDAKGCHVADAFCRSSCVGVKARDKLMWKLKGLYHKLAVSKYGSLALERILGPASVEQQGRVVSELASKAGLLRSAPHSRRLAEDLHVDAFSRSRDQWQTATAQRGKQL